MHCLRQDIYGDWTFHVSTDKEKVNLFEVKDVCTHNLPNGVQVIGETFKFAFAAEELVKVSLKDDYKAEAFMCGSSTSCDKTKVQKVEGKWSTIYDQAIKVELNNGMRFISNFRYQAKKELSKDPLNDPMLMMADIHSGDYGSFDSKCDQTMVGFVQQST